MKKDFSFKSLKLFAALLAISFFYFGCSQSEEVIQKPMPEKINYDRFGMISDSFYVKNEVIKKNETLADILTNAKIEYNIVANIYNTSKPSFDFRKIQPKRNYAIYFNKDSLKTFNTFIYEINKTKYIKVKNDDSLKVEIVEREVEKVEKSVYGVINSSLYQTLMDQNSSIVLAGELAEVFAWQIDFYTIQKGDEFFALYEELHVEDEMIGIGRIIAAKFIHKNNTFNAFLFNQNGKDEYFDEVGKSLQKEFLKAPLKYKRISSGYSGRRLHPILRVYRPHRGIDYAAAVGTPVQAVGDGIVIKAGREGAAGKMIKIRHNSVYSSAYLHLSGYAKNIRTGVKINQGDVIGYVGSTGRSTGPHLDFRFWKNGSLVNYLTQKFPASKSVADSNMIPYATIRDRLTRKVERLFSESI